MENNNNNTQNQQEESVQLMDLLYKCLSKWYWFVISAALCLALAVFYVLKTPPVYTRSAEIQIKTNSRGQSISTDAEISQLGLFNTNTNVYNEIKAFGAKSLMQEVVKRLNLDMNYITDGRFHDNVLYGRSLPFTAAIIDVPDQAVMSFDLDVKEDGAFTLSNFTLQNEPVERGARVSGAFADTLVTPVGNVVVTPTVNYVAMNYPTVHVKRSSYRSATNRYSSELSVNLSDKMSQVIQLTLNDISIQRAEDILDMVVSVYNENWVADKNQIAVSTSMFINERLGVIEEELTNVDSDISNYKSQNLIPDVKAASSMYMSQSNAINEQIQGLNNELYMTRYIRESLTDDANKNKVLPANSGISSANIESQISDYNDKLLRRNDLVANSSESNPLVVELDNSLNSLRQAIISSVDNQELALSNQISSLTRTERQATARIAANPTQAKYLLSVERQQSVKEALYLYLLQKREENELSQAFTAYNTRIIDPPTGSMSPTAPRKSMIYLLALLLGLCIPLAALYLMEVLNTRVRGKKDIKDVVLPFAGEIPLTEEGMKSNKRYLRALKMQKQVEPKREILVKTGSRDTINEAFRVLRTNIEFMMKNKDANVAAVTSFNPGSGKSFISMNLAVSLAIKGRKVLVVDCDLRHASLSTYVDSPHKGISNYLSGQTDDIDSLICPVSGYDNLFVLPVGVIPPNPTELVADERFKLLIAKLKGEYDYVFLDCPPIEIVADTQIIDQYADRTLFVIRAGLCERSMLSELNSLYEENKYNNLALILNGTEISKSGYFGNKYGYHYGHYGHYGYGYSSYAHDDKSDS
ncbi:MAG: polysaccharide biosynthesis tyrosine autokinase [Bacteroidales bacterium]|nr:polysaccharide biosynthesis tyrosine autokinase [Bacteroidales bacterium]